MGTARMGTTVGGGLLRYLLAKEQSTGYLKGTRSCGREEVGGLAARRTAAFLNADVNEEIRQNVPWL